jgi:site-specific recombinase XerC
MLFSKFFPFHKTVIIFFNSTKAPVVKKDPVSTDILISLCTMFQGSIDLTVVRDLTMILLCYSAFLRFSELSQLKCHHITVKDV